MKLIIRCFVLALAVTGVIATPSANGSSVQTSVKVGKTSAWPVPTCEPNTGNYCGMGGGNN